MTKCQHKKPDPFFFIIFILCLVTLSGCTHTKQTLIVKGYDNQPIQGVSVYYNYLDTKWDRQGKVHAKIGETNIEGEIVFVRKRGIDLLLLKNGYHDAVYEMPRDKSVSHVKLGKRLNLIDINQRANQ